MEGEVEGPPRLGTEVVDEEEALLAAMNEAARLSEARATAEVSGAGDAGAAETTAAGRGQVNSGRRRRSKVVQTIALCERLGLKYSTGRTLTR